jgi:hypothetical protein
MNNLQLIRLVEELDRVQKRLDPGKINAQLQSLRGYLPNFVQVYNSADSSDSPESLKRCAVQGSAVTIELCEWSRSFTQDVLVPSGLLSTVGSNSLVLAELSSLHPNFFTAKSGIVELQKAGANGPVFQAVFDESLQTSDLPMRVSFFSPSQAELAIEEALTSAIQIFSEIREHNTRWWGVALGAVRVVGGIVGKFGGAAACLTGAGCIVGAVGIVAGMGNIIGGVQDIADALNEP